MPEESFLNDNDEEDHHATRQQILKMQAVEKRVTACRTVVFPSTIPQYDIELCHGKPRDRSRPSFNDNRQQQISFRREQCNGKRTSNACITHNETQVPDKIAESIKENTTNGSTPKGESTTVDSRRPLVVLADSRTGQDLGSSSRGPFQPPHQLAASDTVVAADMMGKSPQQEFVWHRSSRPFH